VDETVNLILAEIKGLREDTKANGEQLARLVTQMYSLLGNEQPARITLLEQAVDALKEWRWWVIGVAAGGAGVVSFIAWLVELQMKR
jgi:hypothetical protein